MKLFYLLLVLKGIAITTYAQELPPVKILRAEESYSSLLKNDSLRNSSALNKLKAIPLNASGDSYLTLGGEFRPRLEITRNAEWSKDEDADETFYSQRAQFFADFHLGKMVRVFAHTHHGLISRKEPEYTQSDKLDLHQAFVDFSFHLKQKATLTLRAGRQEIFLGTGRLMALRDGLNIRRSFDMGRIIYTGQKLSSHLWYGREVRIPVEVFDNNSSQGAYSWGSYNILTTPTVTGSTDLYYFGYKSSNRYDDGVADETRHTAGFRRWGALGERFAYNTELNFQFGDFGNKKIRAFSIEGDWHYIKENENLRTDIGIKLDYISGDKTIGDDKLGTFNPMFNNPSYFGLITQITAMNLFDVHPSVKFTFHERFSINAETDFYWRAQLNDALYTGSRSVLRSSGGSKARWIGYQLGLQMDYEIKRNIKLSSETYLFPAGEFIKQTGESASTFYNAVTLWLAF